jgi:uncharacterized membrane protein
MAPPPFTGDCREVEPGACFDWLRQGWAMFMEHPAIWLGSAAVMLFVLLFAFIIATPLFVLTIGTVFGSLLAQAMVWMLLPIFAAGLLEICRTQANEDMPKVGMVLVGFRERLGPLLSVGFLFSAGIFGLALLGFLVVRGDTLGSVVTGRVGGFGIALGTVMLTSLLVFLLSVPIIMATWFAPALVFFHGMAPVPAMQASFTAGRRNWVAMSVFGVLLMIAIFAMLPLMIGLLLVLPVFSGAAYASYKDIFSGV